MGDFLLVSGVDTVIAGWGSSEIRRRAAAVGLLVGPWLYMIGELIHHQAPGLPVRAAAVALAGLVLWVAGILGIVHLLRRDLDRFGLLGGGLALLGLIAVSNIMLLQAVFVLVEMKADNYPDVVDGIFRYVLSITYLFGPVFPLGLFILGLGVIRSRRFPTWAAFVFTIGALSFPVGRIGGVPLLIHLADLVLAIGSTGLGLAVWRRPGLWRGAQVERPNGPEPSSL